jgi:hypothetical protein
MPRSPHLRDIFVKRVLWNLSMIPVEKEYEFSPPLVPAIDQRKRILTEDGHCIPEFSSHENIVSLLEELKKDSNLCNSCADRFCRDEVYGDPHLSCCSQCRKKYHTFCVGYGKEEEWICGQCHPMTEVLPFFLDLFFF